MARSPARPSPRPPAGLGNLVSDVAGLGLSGTIERFAGRLGVPDPRLTVPQSQLIVTHKASTLGSAIGISIGCLLGMLPLLFLGEDEDERAVGRLVQSPKFVAAATRAFVKLDRRGTGALDLDDLARALAELHASLEGLPYERGDAPSREEAEAVMQRFDVDGSGTLDVDEFVAMAQALFRNTYSSKQGDGE